MATTFPLFSFLDGLLPPDDQAVKRAITFYISRRSINQTMKVKINSKNG